jgi:telomere length regulation protein
MAADTREIVDQLRNPIQDLPVLLSLLCAPLGALGLLPPDLRHHNTVPLPTGACSITKHIPSLQQVIIEHVVPVWEHELSEKRLLRLIDLYFCPGLNHVLSSSGEIALHAYTSLLSTPMTRSVYRLLVLLTDTYPIDSLHAIIFFGFQMDAIRRQSAWEDTVRNLAALPAKVANAAITSDFEVSPRLQQGAFFENVSSGFEVIVSSLSTQSYQSGTNVRTW